MRGTRIVVSHHASNEKTADIWEKSWTHRESAEDVAGMT